MSLGDGLSALIPQKDKKSDASQTPDQHATAPQVGAPHEKDLSPAEPEREHREPNSVPLTGRNERAIPRGGNHAEQRGESIFHIETDHIKPNPYQPRKEYKENELQELAQSIREFGIIQPLIVSRMETETERGTDVSYQLISGERRLRAARLIGLKRVPAIVRREPANGEKLLLALIENLERSDLNPIEAARGYARLQDEFQLTQREIAVKVGKSRSAIANALRLLTLPSHMQKALEAGRFTESQGRMLLQETNPHLQEQLFQKLIAGLANGAVSRAVPRGRSAGKANVTKEPFWERRIEQHLGAPVSVERAGEKGRVVITFFSEEEWNELRKKLTEDDEAGIAPSASAPL